MDFLADFYPESKFGGFSDIDGTVVFYSRVNSLIGPSSVVLDIGCGRGVKVEDAAPMRRNLQTLTGKCRRVIGIDVDPAAEVNVAVDEFRLIESSRSPWPIDDAAIDLCLSDSVLEHVEDPELFFSECARVTRPNGYVCLRTANALSYVGLIARLVPNRFHARVLDRVQTDRKEIDVFPVLYRCNTVRQIRRVLDKYRFDHCVYGYEAEPAYLSFSRPLYRLGVAYQKVVPNALRTALFAFARKRPSVTASPAPDLPAVQ